MNPALPGMPEMPRPDIRVDAFGDVSATDRRPFVMGDFFSREQLEAQRLACFAAGRAEASKDAGWLPIESAPKEGLFLAYRPLAQETNDPEIRVVEGRQSDRGCWEATVPDGYDATNFTDGYCKATHWMPLPALPIPPAATPTKEQQP
jgi:hypothetical protein